MQPITIEKTLRSLIVCLLLGSASPYCTGSSSGQDDVLNLATTFLISLDNCSTNKVIAVDQSGIIYSSSADSEFYGSPYGLTSSVPRASLSSDGMSVALELASGPHYGNGAIQFFFDDPLFDFPIGTLERPDGDYSTFRYSSSEIGLVGFTEGTESRSIQASITGESSLLFSSTFPIYGPMQTDERGILFVRDNGPELGLYSRIGEETIPIFEESGVNVGWFTASESGSVIAYRINGGAFDHLIIETPSGIVQHTASSLGISTLDIPFDLTGNGQLLVYPLAFGPIIARNIFTDEVFMVTPPIPDIIQSVDIPCNL